ncbi:hypothetical protein LDENG_00042160, partial [Lucifuga dentata]
MYNPPEVCLSGSYKAEPTTVWQLGVILSTMLRAKCPFRNNRQIIQKKPKVKQKLSE